MTYTYTYDNVGNIATYTAPGKSAVVYTYDKQGQLLSAVGNETYTYTYDDNGNILSVSTSDGNSTTYTYDSANQLTRENNQAAGKTWVWTYDDAGNITSRKEYAYTTGSLGSVQSTINYTYGDSSWGDLLTGWNGKTITSDTIGNMTSDGTWSYTWEHGRELASMSSGGTTWNFTYNADGLRTKRTNGSTTYSYVYNGSSLSQMTVGSNTLYFTYDASGTPLSVTYNGTNYYYATNLQGDVTAILNASGTAVVQYTYDAWGKLLTTTGSMASDLGVHNPLRYRGYVYDAETQLYYLQSRYYNPAMGRFINADNYPTTGQGLTGNNMFAYCGNNPVFREDTSGTFWLSAIVGAVINVTTTYIAAKVTGQDYTWKDAAVAAVSGAANAIPVVGPFLSGAITGIYTGTMASQNGATLGESILCGAVAALCTTASISNLANWQKPALDLVTTAAADLVFGMGYNGMAAATYKAVTTNAQKRTSSNATTKDSGQKSFGAGGNMTAAGIQRGAKFVCVAY